MWSRIFSPYTYLHAPASSPPTLNAGWLDEEHPFPTGTLPASVIERLAILVKHGRTKSLEGMYTRIVRGEIGCVKIRKNGDLRGLPSVRVIGSSGEMLGVMPLAEALRLALKEGLDLVEVDPRAQPPVCKLLDFSKYR